MKMKTGHLTRITRLCIRCKMAPLNEMYVPINIHTVSEEKPPVKFDSFAYGIEGRELNQST